jgi:rhodanese-related sulfurtransferase
MSRMISPADLMALVGTADCPTLIDVRRKPVFDASMARIPGAHWRNHMEVEAWLPSFDRSRPFVVYCAHGHNVSEIAGARLRGLGVDARILSGGIEAYAAEGGLLARRGPDVDPALPNPSVWVTRERPKVDRIACPWLIRRFIDPGAVFHYVAAEWVKDVADELRAIPFDIDGVHYSHRGPECSFDTMLREFGLERDLHLARLARIVRGADTADLETESQAHGLLAILLGLSATEPDDLRQLDKGMIVFDALYGWCRHSTGETHNWPSAKVAA